MSTTEQLERDLTAWFGDTAVRETPEFAQDILMATSGVRQRPRWTFLPPVPRPMARPLLGIRSGSPAQRRLAVLVVVAGMLTLAAGAAWVASQPRLPAPFVPAANGLVAYSRDGDIFTVDPVTRERMAVVTGPTIDSHPRGSPDGTRLAFVRAYAAGERLVIVDAFGSVQAVSGGDPLASIDPDGIRWAPDGTSVLLRADVDERGAVILVDATSGEQTALPIVPWGLEAHWRPPAGRELLFVGGLVQQPALYRYSLEDGTVTDVPGTVRPPAGGMNAIRPIGFTPDGSRFAYHRNAPNGSGFETAVVDVETGEELVLDLGFGRISNDGTRIVGMATGASGDRICIAPVSGGPCEPIEGSIDLVDWTGWASLQWSPDDAWIRSRPMSEGSAVLLDPNGGAPQTPRWAAEGADDWQRRAP